jgi:hypothetical protein
MISERPSKRAREILVEEQIFEKFNVNSFHIVSNYFAEKWKIICEKFGLNLIQIPIYVQPYGSGMPMGAAHEVSWNELITFSIDIDDSLHKGLYEFHGSIFAAFFLNLRTFLLVCLGQKSFPTNIEEQEVEETLIFIRNSVGAFVLHRLCQLNAPSFELLRKLSRLTYEKAMTTGYIVFGNDSIPREISFTDSVPLSSIKDIRKLVEVSKENLALLINPNEQAIGFCKLDKTQMIYVQFCGKDSFKIGYHSAEPFMCVIEGMGALIRNEEENTHMQLIAAMTNNDEATTYIMEVVKRARKQSHGTMVVISDNLQCEVPYLGGRCINPGRIDPQYITQLAGIDGAIYLDTSGNCHAFGVILDGLICKNVNTARGSRYNSAVKYSFMKQVVGRCLAFVMSEDGGIDPVHNLDIDGANIQFQREELFR